MDRRWGARAPLRPHARPPLDPRPDRLLASLPLVKMADADVAVGLVKPVRERSTDDYPHELETQMENLEPQFILRNIPRAERMPDDWLEFDHSRVMVRDWHDLVRAVHGLRYAPPALIDETNLARVRAYRSEMRRLFFENDWTRHFGAERNREVDGPLWRYDPDAPTESS